MLSKSRHGTHLLPVHGRKTKSKVLASLERATPRSQVHYSKYKTTRADNVHVYSIAFYLSKSYHSIKYMYRTIMKKSLYFCKGREYGRSVHVAVLQNNELKFCYAS